MQKAADAFRTISEVADDLALPQHVLRFWETRFPQIRPLKRAGGRRYYRPHDVTLLRMIRQLLYDDGYTIKGVQRLLKEQGAKGLGATARSVSHGDDGAPEPSALSEPTDFNDSLIESALPDEEPAPPTGGPDGFIGTHRRAIEEALATVEECRQLLKHALTRAGPKMVSGD